jgi:hypothetical protein
MRHQHIPYRRFPEELGSKTVNLVIFNENISGLNLGQGTEYRA